ncbi:tRNA pseudouridine(55) synthase TruB [Salibacterium salarium]|uniref:tRNA pseudouridine synthase B n=1 Tax=Salibacterium salarium TaxID=284579 RepID=A0A3R9Q3H8_9BACI|nr:tRNA pseudouridine(55) synthase TruB [Salibacterium salarium]RSL32813.1 tRNA pseudouridine(55) synthase TruB [Salibacterium salarium]
MVDGMIPVYKPAGVTSHDCVIQMRQIFGTKKVGHTGTLDPDVEGVLPVCIGKATKIAEYITDLPKRYEAEVTLGFSTTTEDASGSIVEEREVNEEITEEKLEEAVVRFQGNQIQTPPMYSAVKVKGKRLYEYAREGIEVERPSRNIQVFDITMISGTLKQQSNTVRFNIQMTCSKGTYVRTLAVDIGRSLGYPSHMSYLKRTQSGPFRLDQCYTLEQLRDLKQSDKLAETSYSIEDVLCDFPHIPVSSDLAEQIKNGRVLMQWKEITSSPFVFTYKGKALAVYQYHPNKVGLVKPKTMLSTH